MTLIGHVLPLPFSCGDLTLEYPLTADGPMARAERGADLSPGAGLVPEAVQSEAEEAVQIEMASKHVRSTARCGASILRDTRPRPCGISSRVRHPVPSLPGSVAVTAAHSLRVSGPRRTLVWLVMGGS